MPRLLTALLCAAPLAILAAGCGGDDDGGSSSDLTKYAPADAPLFVEGAVRPDGDLKDSIESILDRFPKGDTVGDELIKSINESSKEDGEDVTYEDDIEPWLGERAAFFATSFSTNPVADDDDSPTDLEDGAFIAETTDEDVAAEKIRELSEQDGTVTDSDYKGITISTAPDDDDPTDLAASAVFDGVAVVGSEQGVKDAIDASSADSLEGNSDYAEFREGYGSDLFASVYVDPKALLDAIPPTAGFSGQQRAQVERQFGDYLDQPAYAAFTATEDEAGIDVSAASSEALNPEQSELMDAGFEDSWAAFALSDLGKSFGFTSGGANFGLPEGQLNQVNAQLRRQLGFDFTDLAGIGDAAFFASGTSIVGLQVGALVQVEDAQLRGNLLNAMRRGVARSGAKVEPLNIEGADEAFSIQLPDLPIPINVATAGDRIAIGGGPATQELISGEGGLPDSEGFQEAEEALGGTSPVFFLEMEPIVDLVDSTGQDDAEFEEARPYLEAFDFFASGLQREGDRDLSRLVVRFSD